MAKEWKEKDVLEAVKLVSEKAATDRKFKQLALKNPAAAIKKVTGRAVPGTMKFILIESGQVAGAFAATIGDGPLKSKPTSKMFCCAIHGRCPCGRTNVYTIRG